MPISTKPVSLPLLPDYIRLYESVLTDAQCDHILSEYSDDADWEKSQVGGAAVVDIKARNADLVPLSKAHSLQRNPAVRGSIDKLLYDASVGVVRKYQAEFPHCRLTSGEGFQLLRYRQGGFYRQHTDAFYRQPRSLACSIALNDDFDGGRWAFFDGALEFAPAKGTALVFPANFLFPHAIQEVLRGTRYSAITWVI